jgi:hypothetical protein
MKDIMNELSRWLACIKKLARKSLQRLNEYRTKASVILCLIRYAISGETVFLLVELHPLHRMLARSERAF